MPLFPPEPIKLAVAKDYRQGSRDGSALLPNISIEEARGIINYLPVALISTGLISACQQQTSQMPALLCREHSLAALRPG